MRPHKQEMFSFFLTALYCSSSIHTYFHFHKPNDTLSLHPAHHSNFTYSQKHPPPPQFTHRETKIQNFVFKRTHTVIHFFFLFRKSTDKISLKIHSQEITYSFTFKGPTKQLTFSPKFLKITKYYKKLHLSI